MKEGSERERETIASPSSAHESRKSPLPKIHIAHQPRPVKEALGPDSYCSCPLPTCHAHTAWEGLFSFSPHSLQTLSLHSGLRWKDASGEGCFQHLTVVALVNSLNLFLYICLLEPGFEGLYIPVAMLSLYSSK